MDSSSVCDENSTDTSCSSNPDVDSSSIDYCRTNSDVSSCSDTGEQQQQRHGAGSFVSDQRHHHRPLSKQRAAPVMPIRSLSRFSMKQMQHSGSLLDHRSPDDEEVELVKERFSKLLLGEDMSGSGKGVCTAVAISNAITNLYATIFGTCHKLEPLSPEKKSMWRREMDCLLSVCDYVVEFYPSSQTLSDGATVEVMATRPRSDLYVNIPALEKLDAMLIEIMDCFHKPEFWYADEGKKLSFSCSVSSAASFRRSSHRNEEKWWLPVPCVAESGLSETARKELQQKRECSNQIHKAAKAINSGILSEMEVPKSFLASLPKCGKASVGEAIYRYLMTSQKFSADIILDCLQISSEHEALEMADRVEAAMHVWRRKASSSHPKSSWKRVKELVPEEDKNVMLANRAENLLLTLKLRFPGLSQTTLDTSKIQFNKDVGQAILESYSRVLESLAFSIVSWIDDVLFADKSTTALMKH